MRRPPILITKGRRSPIERKPHPTICRRGSAGYSTPSGVTAPPISPRTKQLRTLPFVDQRHDVLRDETTHPNRRPTPPTMTPHRRGESGSSTHVDAGFSVRPGDPNAVPALLTISSMRLKVEPGRRSRTRVGRCFLMLVMDNRYAPGMRKWNLRFGLTSRCNIRCRYCLPAGKQPVITQPSFEEAVEVLQAAHDLGFRRVHYTGGEPTVRRDFVDILRAAKDIGYSQQIVTTNGYRLHRFLPEAVEAGLTRAIISIDTLDEQKNLFITRSHFHSDTLKSIESAVELLPTMTKISCVTMRDTLDELPAFIEYAQGLNSRGWPGKLAIKLNQFFPSNPAQLTDEGDQFWKDQFVEEDVILEALAKAGELKPIARESIEGDNPSYNYFEVGDSGVKVAVLAMFSWGYPCGGCWKLRISPQGLATICISQKDPPVLWGMGLDEKRETFKRLTGYRDSPQFDIDFPDRRHYRPQLGELRFDKVAGSARQIVFFEDILTRDKTVPVVQESACGSNGCASAPVPSPPAD
ncbi:MAG: radical SAM protein [Streptosporangiales bacterium]|nr:radical SAM protein [Streptosporangiales bacterium]